MTFSFFLLNITVTNDQTWKKVIVETVCLDRLMQIFDSVNQGSRLKFS